MDSVGFKFQILAKCFGVYGEFQGIFGVFFLRVQWALMANFGKIYWSLEKWKFKCLLEVMGTVGFKVQILAKCIGVYREFQGIFGGV